MVFFNVNPLARGEDIMILSGDQHTYWSFTQAILSDSSWLYSHVSERPPGYPLFLSIVSYLFGSGQNFIVIMFIQCIMSAFSVLIIYYLARNIFDGNVAFFASLWAAIYPFYLQFTGFILRETLVVFLFLLFMYVLIEFIRKGKFYFTILLAVVYTIIIHTDPRFLFHLPFILVYLYVGLGNIKKSAKVYATFVLIVFLCSLPWAIRNTVAYQDKFVLINTKTKVWVKRPLVNIGVEKENKSAPGVNRLDTLERFEARKKQAIELYVSQRNVKTSKGSQYLPAYARLSEEEVEAFEHGARPTFDTPRLFLYHFIEFWRFTQFKSYYKPYPDLRFQRAWPPVYNLVGILSRGILIPFFLAGIFFSIKQKKKYGLIFTFIIGVHTLLHVIVHSQMRYALPIDSFVMILSSYGLLEISSYYKKSRASSNYAMDKPTL